MAYSFIFGGKDMPKTPQELARMRAIANSLRSNRAPRDVGEGLQALGNGLVIGVTNARANSSEKSGREGANSAFQSIMSALGGGATPSVSGNIPSNAGDPVSARANSAFSAFGGQGGNYADAIASIESAGSGDYSAVGPETGKGKAYGRYQVMSYNIGPWTEKYVGKRMTPQEFLASPEAQDKVFNGEFGSYVQKYGNPQDAASAWFTGKPLAQGANRSDVNGMTGSRYVDKFTNALGPQASAAPASPVQIASAAPVQSGPVEMRNPPAPTVDQMAAAHDTLTRSLAPPQGPQDGQTAITQAITPQAPMAAPMRPQSAFQTAPQPPQRVAQAGQPPASSGFDLNAAIAVLNNPYLNDGQRAVLQNLVTQELQKRDPMRQMQLQKGQLEIDRLRNPPQPDSVIALEQRARLAGLQPGTKEYADFMISGGRQGITVDARQMGTIPPGYRMKYDEQGRPVSMEPIPGGPAAAEAQATADAAVAKDAATARSGNVVLEDIDRALSGLDQGMLPTSGPLGGALSNVPGTQAFDVGRLLDTVRANSGFDRLQAMRDSSPTGGALGQVSEREMTLLQAAIGNLSQSQSEQQLKYNLNRVRRIYDEIINGPQQRDQSAPTIPDTTGDAFLRGQAPQDIPQSEWAVMTPEERARIIQLRGGQ